MESIQASPNSDSIPLAKAEEQNLRMILKKFGLESVYPVAEDFYKDTEAKQAQQRKLYFDLIRSNPQVAGYSFTSAVDGGYVGEGFLGFIREFKKDQLEVIQQGWASLRWCMFASPAAIYADEEITLEAVLANEDVLDEGTYKATLTVFGDEGIVWRQKCTFDIQKEGDYLPLAVEVFREKVKIDGLKEGTYTFAAELTKGGYAVADRTTFTVKERVKTQRLSGTVYTFGEVDDGVLKLLREYGAEVKELTLNSPQTDREVILVGKTVTWSKSELSQLYRRIAAGSHAVFLYPAMLANETDLDYVKLGKTKKTAVNLMFENSTEKATLVRPWQWLYHTEAVAKPCPMLTGLDDRGIMDIEFYSSAVADRMFIEGMPLMPEEYGVVDIGIGNSVYDSGYSAGIVLGSFGFYSGSYTVSCFSLADNIGQPGADRLLVNIVARAAQLANAAQEVSQEAETAIRQFFR